MAHHRIYKYTSIGRPLEPEYPDDKAVLILMPLAALLGAVTAWLDGGQATQVLQAGHFLPPDLFRFLGPGQGVVSG